MKQPEQVLENGTKIVTHETLHTTGGLMVRPDAIGARRGNKKGSIKGLAGGHGGDVYLVEHADGSIAAYGWAEFELATPEGVPRATGVLKGLEISIEIIARTIVRCPECGRQLSEAWSTSADTVTKIYGDVVKEVVVKQQEDLKQQLVERGWTEVMCGRCRDR